MRVAIDLNPLRQTQAGTARYIDGIMRGLRDEVEFIPRVYRHCPSAHHRSAGRRLRAGMLDAWWYPISLPLATSPNEVDLVHCPTFRAPFVLRRPLRLKVPLIVTVHDLAVLARPELANGWTRWYSHKAVPRVVAGADRIIAPTVFTKTELVERLGISEDVVRVIPLGIEPVFFEEGGKADGDYILFVGSVQPRKNLRTLIEATARLGLVLKIAGTEEWGGVDTSAPHVERIRHADDELLASLYRGALCTVCPSVYEGFGLPVLEAMAAGSPVVAHHGGGTSELAADAAIVVDCLEVDELADGIERAISTRERLVEKGRAHASRFDWGVVASQTMAVYRELAAT